MGILISVIFTILMSMLITGDSKADDDTLVAGIINVNDQEPLPKGFILDDDRSRYESHRQNIEQEIINEIDIELSVYEGEREIPWELKKRMNDYQRYYGRPIQLPFEMKEYYMKVYAKKHAKPAKSEVKKSNIIELYQEIHKRLYKVKGLTLWGVYGTSVSRT